MESKAHLLVSIPLRPQELYQLRTTGHIWPRRFVELQLSPQHLCRLHKTGRIIPRSTPSDQDQNMYAQYINTRAWDKEQLARHPQDIAQQQRTQASKQPEPVQRPQTKPIQQNPQTPTQQKPAWQPQTPPQEETQAPRPQAPESQPPKPQAPRPRAPRWETRVVPPSQQIRPQHRLYNRSPREVITHRPGEIMRRYRSPPRGPIPPYTSIGTPWINRPPENTPHIRLPLHHSVQSTQQQPSPDPPSSDEDKDPLDADLMNDLSPSYEARRAQAVADQTIQNIQIQFGKDSHSWLCTACNTLVDPTQESHKMGCRVAWGGDGRRL